MKKLSLSIIVAALIAVPLSAGTIRIAGSSTMAELNGKLGKAFTAANPQIRVTVSVSDSTVGLTTLIAGDADVASATRPIKAGEAAKLPNHKTVVVGKDAAIFYVNASNSVRALTYPQIKAILNGTYTNWKEVGGKDGPIHLIGREIGSATQKQVTETFLGSASIVGSKQAMSAPQMLKMIADDPYAFGFAGLVHPPTIRALSIIQPSSPIPTAANIETIDLGVYPLTRIMYFYVPASASEETKKFLEFVRTAEGQKIVVDEGFVRAK